MPKKKKVFCSRCRFLVGKGAEEYFCNHADNSKLADDSWFSPDTVGVKHPSDINKKNNCKWYRAKHGNARE